jgi:tetratricopeptide (TPR) repeat protein
MEIADAETVRQQTDRIIGSPRFKSSPRLAQLLQFLVSRPSSDPSALKEAVIAHEVFGRSPSDYDSGRDALVRVTVGKLRTRLTEYYAAEGANDPVVIVIPRGSYAPEFQIRTSPPEHAEVRPRRRTPAIVGSVVLAIAALTMSGSTAKPPVAPEVLELFNHGRLADESAAAVRYFEQVVQRAPRFGAGWVALGNAYMWASASRGYMSPAEAQRRALAAAETAVRLDPNRGDAHSLLGHVLGYKWDLEGSERHLRKAVKLSPGHVPSQVELAAFLSKIGRHQEAVEFAHAALKPDPLFYQANVTLIGVLYTAGMLDEAQHAAERTLRLREDSTMALYYLGRIALRRNRASEAVHYLDQSRKHSVDPSHAAGAMAMALVRAGRSSDAEQMWENLVRVRSTRYISPVRLSQVRLALGDQAGALSFLEEAERERDFSLLSLATDDTFEPLRAEPAFVSLLRRLRLAE